jgi:hypothetical protein
VLGYVVGKLLHLPAVWILAELAVIGVIVELSAVRPLMRMRSLPAMT